MLRPCHCHAAQQALCTRLVCPSLSQPLQHTAFLCAQQIFKPHQYQIGFFSNHRVNFPFFAVVFAVVKQIWDFGKRCKVFLICMRVWTHPIIAPGHNPVNWGFRVQKSAWMNYSATAVHNLIWFLLNADSRFCNIYSCDGLCESGRCCGDQCR